MAGLGALAELQLDHLDLRVGSAGGKQFGREAAVRIASAEIARARFPDDVATAFAVIGTVAAFAGIVGKAAEPGAVVQCPYGVGTEGAEAHGGNVEDRRRIG